MSNSTLRKNKMPLYLQIAESLRQNIIREVWKAGDFLPTIHVLANNFGVAKITIRKAFEILEEEGFIQSRRGYGTQVIQSHVHPKRFLLETTFADLASLYQNDQVVFKNIEAGDVVVPNFCDADGSADFRYIKRTHFRDDIAFCVIAIHLRKSIYDTNPHEYDTRLALPVINEDENIQLVHAKQTLKIAKCDLETAEFLNLSLGDPVAEVHRVLYDENGQVLYTADVTYRGDIIEWHMNFQI